MSDKVIVFSERRIALITQMDLAEERALAIDASQALNALEEKRGWIRARLQEGWKVEEGLRRADLIPIAGGSYTRKPGTKLMVR